MTPDPREITADPREATANPRETTANPGEMSADLREMTTARGETPAERNEFTAGCWYDLFCVSRISSSVSRRSLHFGYNIPIARLIPAGRNAAV
jgi:hypothetical protein